MHLVLVGLPQGVGWWPGSFIQINFALFYFELFLQHTRTKCSLGSSKGLMALLF
jgi:hypothetical protein